MRRTPIPLLLALSLAVLPGGPASAVVACSVNGTTLDISLSSPIEPVRIVRAGTEVEVHVGSTKQLCANGTPTVATVDLVQVVDLSPGSAVLTIDLTGGPFEPGVGAEDTVDATPTPEIEFVVDLGFGSSDELVILGTGGDDHFVLGADGINLNAAAEAAPGASHDADVTTVSVEIHTIHANGGDDILDGTGPGGTSRFPARTQLYGGTGNDLLTGGSVADLLVGDDGDDVLAGGEGDDEILGGAGLDTLLGEEGNDLLDGGPGADVEDGGPGDDTFDQGPDPNGADLLDGGEGDLDVLAYDLRDGDLEVTLDGAPGDGETGEGDDAGSDIEGVLGGSGNDTLVGGPGNNFLRGRGGDDVLRGEAGDDLLTGGGGNDVLLGGDGADTASFFSAPGPVQVDLKAGAASGQGADAISGVEHVEGSQFGDVLAGDGGPNTLLGEGGDDRLLGREGDDLLGGGNGADTLAGGGGNDVLDGGTETDLADFASAPAKVTADLNTGAATGDGADLMMGIENLRGGRFGDTLIGDFRPNRLIGGRGPDRLDGGGGRDRLIGGKGNDVMFGGRGRDLFIEESVRNGRDRIDGGAGKDLVSYAKRTKPVRVTLDGRSDDGEARERDRVGPGIEEVRGGKADDTLIGNGKPNRLFGGPGDDELHGRGGRDVLIGGPGNDLLDGGPGRDRCRGAVPARQLACER